MHRYKSYSCIHMYIYWCIEKRRARVTSRERQREKENERECMED